MAQSPSHKMGQEIGFVMEKALYALFEPLAKEFSLYLDRQEPRVARQGKKKVTWIDDANNKHDLDFVFEKGGSANSVGKPRVFIESAWRRYTKHSVNKAGEIANSLVPLRRTYRDNRPFLGAIVAGDWTAGGLQQLRSQGVQILHIKTEQVVSVFKSVGLDFAFDENTPDAQMLTEVQKWSKFYPEDVDSTIQAFQDEIRDQFDEFAELIRQHLNRRVERVTILPLFGTTICLNTLEDAATYLSKINDGEIPLTQGGAEFKSIVIDIYYSNSDVVNARLSDINEAINWINQQLDWLNA